MKGLELSRRFYFEAVRPILDRRFPGLEHAAALIGSGSEVLGYDDDLSTDHHWGPRVLLFLPELAAAPEIDKALAEELPTTFAGFATNFGPPDEIGVRLLVPVEDGPVAHRVELFELGEFLRVHVGRDARRGFTVEDWLATPTQRLLQVTAGEVFADPIGELTQVRERLAWYPHDVWLLVLAAHWSRIGELEHFLGRTGARGDELGSRLIAASLVRYLMRLALLQERRYPPYPKWLGTAYEQVGRPERETLERALAADDWRTREDALVEAYEHAARRHNELGLTDPIDPTARRFHGRPFRVIGGDRFASALRAAISDPAVRAVRDAAVPVDAAPLG
ncbi:MAG TPA: DUF4037 domain-containing protein [Gaiellaceae bacterium]|nr:DUF4037 domain-containing protein [Gaiellaceae bacterium]